MQAVSTALEARPAVPRTEGTVATETAVLLTLGALSSPLMLSLAGNPLRLPWAAVLDGHTQRQITGYTGLALVLLQLLLAVRRRRSGPGSLRSWVRFHKWSGLPILLIVLAHTGGSWGVNLNGWLLGSIVGMMLVAQAGHVAKAIVASRASSDLDASVNGEHGDIHKAGLFLHITFAVCVVCFLAFHVFSVYYF